MEVFGFFQSPEQGRCDNPLVGVCTPEFTRLISCSIVNNHHLFQCHKEMFFGCLQAVGAERQAWSSNIFNVPDNHPLSGIGPTMVDSENISSIEVIRWLENAILNLVFANNRAFLPISFAESTESVLDALSYLESTIRPTMVRSG